MKKNILFIIILQIFGLTVNASDMRHKAMLDNRDTITSNITDTICFGGGYQENGFDIPGDLLEVGLNYDSLFLTTEAGDDSIVSLELYVAPVYSMTLYDTTCYGGGYYDFGFSIDSLGLGWNYDTLFLETTLGCDSTVCLELYAAPVYDTTFTDTICFGGIYIGHGFELEPADTGWNYDTLFLETVLGCDSTVCLELYVAPTYDITLYDSICHGEDYHKYNFDTIAPATGMCVMQQELLTALGCDSIVTMNLFVKEVYDITINDTICFGEDYDGYNFHLVEPEVGTHNEVQTLTTTLGCDSIVSLSLYVAPVYRFSVTDSICEGEDYVNYGLYIPAPEAGRSYEATSYLTTETGCDSIFDVTFKVTYVYEEPDTIYGLNNVYVSTGLIPGMYKYSIDTIEHCEKYHWELDNENWYIQYDKTECTIIVNTPETSTLTVWAGNSCDTVYRSIEIQAGYFGVDETDEIKANVYPNPSDGMVHIESNGIEKVEIINATGAVVWTYIYGYEDSVTIDLGELPDSIYLLKIKTRDGEGTKRVVKTH
ncbi:MAG: T9SS type A sorting domain-containing protein [Bacteroidales bacterium]|nr:T9SS type A sorting domain-containing protein [Bacteroidales bacterium]